MTKFTPLIALSRLLRIAGLTLGLGLAAVALPAAAQSVSLSLSVVQPGVYGRIDIGPEAPPAGFVVGSFGVPARVVVQQPMYIYAPEDHWRHWSEHCHRYNACGRPVYFVDERWVRARHAERHEYGRERQDERRDERREEHRERHEGHEHGRERD